MNGKPVKREDPSAELYRAADFDAFWQTYRRMHADPRTRTAHAVATGSAIAIVAIAAVRRDWRWLAIAPIVDYAIAQSSHRLFERNRTSPWRHPTWHERAELRLFRETCARGMTKIAMPRRARGGSTPPPLG